MAVATVTFEATNNHNLVVTYDLAGGTPPSFEIKRKSDGVVVMALTDDQISGLTDAYLQWSVLKHGRLKSYSVT